MIQFDHVIRPSSTTDWLDCARRWAARHQAALVQAMGYALRPLPPKHIGAHVGTAVHAGAAYTLTEKMKTGGLGNEGEAIDRAVSAMKTEMDANGITWDATTDRLSTAQLQVARMTKVHRAELAPTLMPIVVETRVQADVGDGWTVSGQLDELEQAPDALHDLKTGTSRRAHAVQYGTYKMLFEAHGYAIGGLVEDFLPRVRIEKPQPPPTAHAIDMAEAVADAWHVIGEIKRDTEEFARRAAAGSGAPPHSAFRANPDSSLCSPRWCPAHGTDFCKAHLR